ncbi:MAG: lamin tail domain-containing protein, partial [Candidatus Bipolaricaulota bacterium]|nr:lamin tail domain-containing protein [Candidatus Bipolaricaulota bacterium]
MRVRGMVVLLACVLLGTLLAASAADAPAARTIVINEVELNPDGLDRDAEWVELLNVGSTTVDVVGWSLTYDYPIDGAEIIATESLVIR